MSPPTPSLTVAQRASLLRACNHEEENLEGLINHYRQQVAQGIVGAQDRLTVAESEMVMLHSAVRALWRS